MSRQLDGRLPEGRNHVCLFSAVFLTLSIVWPTVHTQRFLTKGVKVVVHLVSYIMPKNDGT